MKLTEHSITEDDIANFLANTPDFFERHAELLATVQLSSGHGNRAVSLQERQAGMLREKIKTLETRVVEMIRHAQDNLVIAGKMHGWTRALLRTAQAGDIPAAIIAGLASEFGMPQAAIRVWGVSSLYADEPYVIGSGSDVQTFAASLALPYCGINAGFEAAGWLPEPALAESLALVPLRTAADAPVLGLLVLASPDAQRFHAGMGTEFLERLGEMAAAALARLGDPAAAQSA